MKSTILAISKGNRGKINGKLLQTIRKHLMHTAVFKKKFTPYSILESYIDDKTKILNFSQIHYGERKSA